MTQELSGHLAMICFSFLVAGSFALGNLIANNVAPLVVTVLRFVITVVFLGGLRGCRGISGQLLRWID